LKGSRKCRHLARPLSIADISFKRVKLIDQSQLTRQSIDPITGKSKCGFLRLSQAPRRPRERLVKVQRRSFLRTTCEVNCCIHRFLVQAGTKHSEPYERREVIVAMKVTL
jgi:hypothetical protein